MAWNTYSPRRRARAELASLNAKKILVPGDRILVGRDGGMQATYTFKEWDGHWMVSASGLCDLAPSSLKAINRVPINIFLHPQFWLKDNGRTEVTVEYGRHTMPPKQDNKEF